jgi:hypothetical protein
LFCGDLGGNAEGFEKRVGGTSGRLALLDPASQSKSERKAKTIHDAMQVVGEKIRIVDGPGHRWMKSQ